MVITQPLDTVVVDSRVDVVAVVVEVVDRDDVVAELADVVVVEPPLSRLASMVWKKMLLTRPVPGLRPSGRERALQGAWQLAKPAASPPRTNI